MTVSMLTTRLSEVITGCGGNETTCSRRSTPARTRSTNGISRCSPASRVREYRPRRSTITATVCGTIRTERNSAMMTNSRTSARTTISAIWPTFVVSSVMEPPGRERACRWVLARWSGGRHGDDDGRRAVDAVHRDLRAGRQRRPPRSSARSRPRPRAYPARVRGRRSRAPRRAADERRDALVSTSGVRFFRWRSSHGRNVTSSRTDTTAATRICAHTGAPAAEAMPPASAPPAAMMNTSRARSSRGCRA